MSWATYNDRTVLIYLEIFFISTSFHLSSTDISAPTSKTNLQKTQQPIGYE